MKRTLVAAFLVVTSCATEPFEAARLTGLTISDASADQEADAWSDQKAESQPEPSSEIAPETGSDQGPELGTDATDAGPEADSTAESEAEPESEPEAGSEPTLEAQPEATEEAEVEADTEPCVPDTCQVHGWACGSANDGCGGQMQCGEAYHRMSSSQDYLCDVIAMRPYAWTCSAGGTSTAPGPPPMPECMWTHPTSTPTDWYWCCPKASL